jgi:hypothetical protein
VSGNPYSTDRDLMNIKTQKDEGRHGIGWPAGIVGGLLLISVGLDLLAHPVFGLTDAATLILSLYLGFWTYVLGIVGFVILSTKWLVDRWLVDWRRVQLTRTTMSRYSPLEPRSERLEEPESDGSQFLEHDDVSPVIPSRLSRHSEDRNKVTSSTRVA